MGEILSQISDVLTAKLPEIIAIVTSGGFAFYLFKLLCSLIVTKIQNKTKEKFSKPILNELEEVKAGYETLKDEIKQLLAEHNAESDNRIKKAFEEEAERKAVAYQEVLNEELVIEKEEVVEPVVEVVKPENVEQVLEEEIEPIKETKTVAKRVIVND